MAKKPTTYRQIVSIPANLKERMDKVADQVNWSAVAARAFEEKLKELESGILPIEIARNILRRIEKEIEEIKLRLERDE